MHKGQKSQHHLASTYTREREKDAHTSQSRLYDLELDVNLTQSMMDARSTWRKRQVRVVTENREIRRRLQTLGAMDASTSAVVTRPACDVCRPRFSYFESSTHAYKCLYRPTSVAASRERSQSVMNRTNTTANNNWDRSHGDRRLASVTPERSHYFVADAMRHRQKIPDAVDRIRQKAECLREYGCGRAGRTMWAYNDAFYGIGVWRHFSAQGRMLTCGWHSNAKLSHRLCEDCYADLPPPLRNEDESTQARKADSAHTISLISRVFDTNMR